MIAALGAPARARRATAPGRCAREAGAPGARSRWALFVRARSCRGCSVRGARLRSAAASARWSTACSRRSTPVTAGSSAPTRAFAARARSRGRGAVLAARHRRASSTSVVVGLAAAARSVPAVAQGEFRFDVRLPEGTALARHRRACSTGSRPPVEEDPAREVRLHERGPDRPRRVRGLGARGEPRPGRGRC